MATSISNLRLVGSSSRYLGIDSDGRQKANPSVVQLDGLLALMVTDLEGFTTLVEEIGDIAAQVVICEHNRVVRASIRRYRGREVTHTGDGVIAAFRSLVAAIGCARDIQDTILARAHGRLRTRIGIHAGEPLPEDQRLFGHCVNATVRVCGVAEPGRVLVTEVVEQLTRGRFSFGKGELHHLKGMKLPMRLFELV